MIQAHDSVMLHVYGLFSLHLNLLLEVNTHCIIYPKNMGSVNISDEVYYSVACMDKRRSTRDRYCDWEVRSRLRWVCRQDEGVKGRTCKDAGVPCDSHWLVIKHK